MTGRSVAEWIGRTPDSKVPPHVRVRIFDAHDGRCHITGRKIRAGEAWELEHRKALRDGGENRESNLAPALVEPHKGKTRAERKRGAKADHARQKHLLERKTKWRAMPGGRDSTLMKKMDGSVVDRRTGERV